MALDLYTLFITALNEPRQSLKESSYYHLGTCKACELLSTVIEANWLVLVFSTFYQKSSWPSNTSRAEILDSGLETYIVVTFSQSIRRLPWTPRLSQKPIRRC